MTFEELKNVMPHCPNCGRHCPIDDLNCDRGKEMVEKILAGEAAPEDYLNHSHEEGEHRHHRHEHEDGERGHGKHEEGDHEHGHRRHDHEGRGCKRHGEFDEEREGRDFRHHGEFEDESEARDFRHHREFDEEREGHDFRHHREFDEEREGRDFRHHGERDERPHRGFGPRGEGRRRRPMPPMPEDDSLMSLLFHTVHAVRPRPEHGPGMGQKRVLTVLNEEGSLSQSVLQEKLAIRPGSLSELLGKLEGKGLIQRIPDPEDRRKNLLSLTEEGKAELQKNNERGDFEKDAFSMLNEEETETLKTLLKKILEGRRGADNE